jgi:hypothetical protein
MDWLSIPIGAAVGAGAWVATNAVGGPILAIREMRMGSIRSVETLAFVSPASSEAGEQRVRDATDELNGFAASLRAQARGQNWAIRAYCHWMGYDLELAARALFGLARMAGDPRYGDTTKKNNAKLLCWALRADNHLSADEIAELKKLIAEATVADHATA